MPYHCKRLLAGLAFFNAGMGASWADDAGEAAFKAQCARCHIDASAAAKKIDGATADEKAAFLTKFLEKHMKSDPATRPALIKYLIPLADK